jgi:hypothetical protein
LDFNKEIQAMRGVYSVLAVGCLVAAGAAAQEKKVLKEQVDDVIVFHAQAPEGAAAPGQRVMVRSFFAGKMDVKGAPYAAESVNESTQVLADGTRITNKSTTKTWRDSEGRTRMESSFTPVGSWVPSGELGSMISISDPVAGEHITLNTREKTAIRTKLPARAAAGAGPAWVQQGGKEVNVQIRKELPAGAGAAAPGGNVMFFSEVPDAMPIRVPFPGGDVKAEQLGKQTIEGVQCDGVRETMTIPAGTMGNDRPILITTERWSSPELGIEVLRKHNDPRTGEMVYRVTMLHRGEQPRSLFEVPADYKTQEAPKVMRFERRVEPKDNI